ncbi:MAG: hypothetical protein ABI699_15145 [Caldimonas sp.]
MPTRMQGILASRTGERTINKQYKGERIFARLGKSSQDDAEPGSGRGKLKSTPNANTNFEKALTSCSQLLLRST